MMDVMDTEEINCSTGKNFVLGTHKNAQKLKTKITEVFFLIITFALTLEYGQ